MVTWPWRGSNPGPSGSMRRNATKGLGKAPMTTQPSPQTEKSLILTTEVIPLPLPSPIAIRDDDVEVDPIFNGIRYIWYFGSPHALLLKVCGF